jgi:hypothetical protein
MLWGYLPHFFLSPDWDQETLFQSIDHVDRWHEKIGMAALTDHDFLDDGYTVEKTTFSTGDAIICNFGDQAFTHQGKVIEPGDYLILD